MVEAVGSDRARARPFNAEPDPRQLGVDRVTDTTRFYSRNHGAIPTIDPVGWELPIDGLVGQPIVLRLSDLQSRFEHVTIDATLQCAGNLRSGLFSVAEIPGEAPWGAGATSSAVWTGVRLADVLASVEVLPRHATSSSKRRMCRKFRMNRSPTAVRFRCTKPFPGRCFWRGR